MGKQFQPSLVALIIGVVVTIIVSVVTYLYPQSREITDTLIVALIGIAITAVLESRVKMREVEDSINRGLSDVGNARKILANSRKDKFFLQRYDALKQEIDELASGVYRVAPLNALYFDDIRSMDSLIKGERLLSTCPVSTTSREAALGHITDRHYTASTDAHLRAADRGVKVTRLFLFKTRTFFDQQQIKAHLSGFAERKIDIQVLFLDEANLRDKYDFVVFGDKKVSIGDIDPATGQVTGAYVHFDSETVKRYIEKFAENTRLAHPIRELLRDTN